MAYILVLDGINFRVQGKDDPYKYWDEINENVSYQKLRKLCQRAEKDNGIIVNELADSDEGVLNVYLGKELWPDRYIYKYQTIVCIKNDNKNEDVEKIAKELEQILKEQFPDAQIERQAGIIVSQFD